MSIGRNVLAGVANSAWTAILGLAALPLYLKYLGIGKYGLIGFYATAQAMLQLLDMGLSPAMNREVARCSISGRMPEARNLLHTLTLVYWFTAGGIVLAIALLAPAISRHWLDSGAVDAETVRHAVMLMGLVVACRWPIGLYQGVLMGMHRLAVSSTINMVMVSAATAGSVVILAFVSPTIEAFFAWQALVAGAQALIMRHVAWRFLGKEGAGSFNFAALKNIWRFSAGMSGIAISSVLLMQLDKLLLSRMLSLEDFGRYVLAGVVAGGLYVLLTPVFNVIYPKMTALLALGEEDELLRQYKDGTRLLASVLFPVAVAISFFADDLLFLWTGNRQLAESTGPLVSLLVMGTSLNGVMHFPLALQLASGKTGLTLTITTILAVALVPMIIFMTGRFGAPGGAAAWLGLNICYLAMGSWMTHRALFKGRTVGWLSHDVGVPLLLSAIVTFLGWELLHRAGLDYRNVGLAGLLALASIGLNVLVLPRATFRRVRDSAFGTASIAP